MTAVPTIAAPVTVDWGDWIDQALAHETPLIEAAAQGAVGIALAQIPFGSIISNFIGPTVVKQYVDIGLQALEHMIQGQKLTIPASSALEVTVANLINTNEPKLAAFLGTELDPMIKAIVAKLGL